MTELTDLLVPMPVLLPLLAAGATLALPHHPRLQRTISVGTLVLVVGVAAALVVLADREGPQVVQVGGWPETLGIALVADRLAAIMLLVSAVVTLAVLVYSIGQGMTGDGEETAPISIYHPTFLVLVAGVANAFLAGDLFNLFVSFEMLLFASYVLLTLGGTAARIRAGTIYVVVNLLSSMLFLVTIALVYAATGSLSLAQLSERIGDLPEVVALVLQLMMLTTFAIKAAVFPLSFWLPDSYPTAPAPVTAVFAGLLTKVGIYAILRTQTLLFPDSPLTDLLLWAALATMLVGILGAIAQSDIKRLLSFTLVSHIGYMLFGIGLGTAAGVSGAIFYVVHHITIQTTLFLVVGLIERRAGSSARVRLGGLARLSPLVAVLFFVPAMNLSGIPPLSGFVGKTGLLQAGIATGTWLSWTLVAGAVVTSLLTLYAAAKTWSLTFWRTPAEAHELAAALPEPECAPETDGSGGRAEVPEELTDEAQGLVRHRGHVHGPEGVISAGAVQEAQRLREEEERDLYQLLRDDALPSRLPAAMVGPTMALVGFSLALTVFAGPLFGYTDRAAADLEQPATYVSSVIGDTP